MNELKCVAGCKHFTGGEIKHHKDCPYYPESFSKMYDDLEEKVKKLNEPAVSKCDGIERESSCNHSDWIDLYYDSGDWYGRYCKDCGEFFE